MVHLGAVALWLDRANLFARAMCNSPLGYLAEPTALKGAGNILVKVVISKGLKVVASTLRNK